MDHRFETTDDETCPICGCDYIESTFQVCPNEGQGFTITCERKERRMDNQTKTITDQQIESAEKLLKVQTKILGALKVLPADERLKVLRAASIIALGKDLHELG